MSDTPEAPAPEPGPIAELVAALQPFGEFLAALEYEAEEDGRNPPDDREALAETASGRARIMVDDLRRARSALDRLRTCHVPEPTPIPGDPATVRGLTRTRDRLDRVIRLIGLNAPEVVIRGDLTLLAKGALDLAFARKAAKDDAEMDAWDAAHPEPTEDPTR